VSERTTLFMSGSSPKMAAGGRLPET
jgi:hypothetical protein